MANINELEWAKVKGSKYPVAKTTIGETEINIIKLDEDSYRLSIAIAGFTKEDIDVSVDNGTLVIKGEIIEVTDAEVVHKGIASRKFARSFALGEYMEVTGADLKDGMLNISIDRIVPEEKKPKAIKIK